MSKTFSRCVEVFEARPRSLVRLANGATPMQLEAFRAAMDVVTPEALLRLHAWRDGSAFGARLADWHWANLAEIIETKRALDRLSARFESLTREEQRVHPEWALWSPSWIPLLDDGSAMQVALTTTACLGGPAGQIIAFDHKGGEGWQVQHESFDDWLATIAVLVEEDLLAVPYYEDAVDAVMWRVNPGRRVVPFPSSMELTDPARFDTPAPRHIARDVSPGASVQIVFGPFENFRGVARELVRDRGCWLVEITVFGRARLERVGLRDLRVIPAGELDVDRRPGER